MPTPAPDLGGASPVWSLLVLAIIVGPFIIGIIYGIKNRRSGAPRNDMQNDAAEYVKIARDLRDVQNDGRGW